MRYRTQAVAYPYFVVAMLFYGLQMAFGLLSAVKYLGPDPIKVWLPFDVSKEIHTNLLIVWVLTGFMGAAYPGLVISAPVSLGQVRATESSGWTTGSSPRSRRSFSTPSRSVASMR